MCEGFSRSLALSTYKVYVGLCHCLVLSFMIQVLWLDFFFFLFSLHSHSLYCNYFLVSLCQSWMAGLLHGNKPQTFWHICNPHINEIQPKGNKVRSACWEVGSQRKTLSPLSLLLVALHLCVTVSLRNELPGWLSACSCLFSWIFDIFLWVAKDKRLVLVFGASPACSRFLSLTQWPLVFMNCFLWRSELFPSPVASPVLLEHREPLQAASAGRDCAALRLCGWEALTLCFQRCRKIFFCSFITCLFLSLKPGLEFDCMHLHRNWHNS